jgi:ribosomal subunit interface protein
MQKQITFRGMESTAALENYSDEQLARIFKFLENEREPIFLHLILTAGRPHAHFEVELLIKSPHYDLIVKDEGSDLYKTLIEVADTMYLQLRKQKKKFIDEERKKDSYKGA